jgi:hypothetical protein
MSDDQALAPKERIDDSEVQGGLQVLLLDGVCSQIMGSFAVTHSSWRLRGAGRGLVRSARIGLHIALGVRRRAETMFGPSTLSLRGLDFLFMIAGLVGFYAMHRLLAVREEGEVEEKVVLSQLYSEVRKAVRHVSNVAGLRQQYYFPAAKLEQLAEVDSAPPPATEERKD